METWTNEIFLAYYSSTKCCVTISSTIAISFAPLPSPTTLSLSPFWCRVDRSSGLSWANSPVSRSAKLSPRFDSIRMPCNLPLPACLPAMCHTLTRNEIEEEEEKKNSLFDGRLFRQPSTIQLWKTRSISSTATTIPSIPRIRHYWLIAFCARNTPSTLGTPYRRLERGTRAVKWNIINQIKWRCCSLFVPP